LSNGCICCTINDNLVDAVFNILERSDPVDYLVIETTGIADPLPILLTFLGTQLRDLTRLDSILTLVDAETFTPKHFDSDVALNQILYGDIVLLNKTDLVPVEQVDSLECYIHTLKQGARIIRSHKAEVPLPLILDVGYTDATNYGHLLNEQEPDQHKHGESDTHAEGDRDRHADHEHAHADHEHAHSEPDHHDHNHHHDHDHHHHSDHLANEGFVSVSFTRDRPFSLPKFQDFLDHLPSNVFRGKGILWFQESPLKHIFQLSGKRCTLDVVPAGTKPPLNQLVFIGRNLDADKIQQGLTQCLVETAPLSAR
jgi:G3E family GTPase